MAGSAGIIRILTPPKQKNPAHTGRNIFVPGQGFEPQFSDSESDVLPLDDPGLFRLFYGAYMQFR